MAADLKQVRGGYAVLRGMQHVVRPVDAEAHGLSRASLGLYHLMDADQFSSEFVPGLFFERQYGTYRGDWPKN